MFDLVIRGGTVIDGTGRTRFPADVAIAAGGIAVVGRSLGPGRRVIDATERIVAPGVIDVHTHYDAQLFWDPAATPSIFHGVTTVVGGNCGFTLAPVIAGDEYLMTLMARVEGMPLAALSAGLDWQWSSFASWLDRLDGRIAINAGFLCGHSALRRFVMGAAATARAATDAEIDAMRALLSDALSAGALGVSSSQTVAHNDASGSPVPSRLASPAEGLALAEVTGQHPGTTLEWISSGAITMWSGDETEFLTALSRTANRPLNWNALKVDSRTPHLHHDLLALSSYAAAHGGRIIALAVPDAIASRLSFATGFVLDALPGWADLFRLPAAERLSALRDSSWRDQLYQGAVSDEAGFFRELCDFDRLHVAEAHTAETKQYEGLTGSEIATRRGLRRSLDAILDVVVADELRTELVTAPFAGDDETWKLKAQVWRDPRVMIGGSDAGAHLDMICGPTLSTTHLGPNVRDRGLLSLEEAVNHLTDRPASLYGLRGRGRVAVGYAADLIVFNPATVGPGPVVMRSDLPGGASRLYAEAEGVDWVLVNGEVVVEQGALTGTTTAGTLLRSGRDTYTVTARS